MDKGNYLCINMDQHSGYEKFDTERDHRLICLKFPQSDGYAVLLLPETTKEPAPRMKLLSTQKGDRGRARTVPLLPRSTIEWQMMSWTMKSWTHLTFIQILRQCN